MFSKRFVPAALTLIFTICGAYVVWSHCHNDDDCEDLHADLISGRKWKPATSVSYHINPHRPIDGLPAISGNTQTAAATWTNAKHNGQAINFTLYYAGTTSKKPLEPNWLKDGWNVVGWTDRLREDDAPAVTKTWSDPNDHTKIIEADTGLNYYKEWEEHDYTEWDDHCVLEVMTHEFGHWVNLTDLYDTHNCDSSYRRYTMWGWTSPDDHHKESLECEDKYAAWYTYHGED